MPGTLPSFRGPGEDGLQFGTDVPSAPFVFATKPLTHRLPASECWVLSFYNPKSQFQKTGWCPLPLLTNRGMGQRTQVSSRLLCEDHQVGWWRQMVPRSLRLYQQISTRHHGSAVTLINSMSAYSLGRRLLHILYLESHICLAPVLALHQALLDASRVFVCFGLFVFGSLCPLSPQNRNGAWSRLLWL